MQQTKIESLLESFLNISSGFVISLVFWSFVIVPLFEMQVTMRENLLITTLFTLISIIRSYCWRRFFNAELHKFIHNNIKKLYDR